MTTPFRSSALPLPWCFKSSNELTLLFTQLIMSLSSIFVPSGVSFESKARVYALICCQTIAVKGKRLCCSTRDERVVFPLKKWYLRSYGFGPSGGTCQYKIWWVPPRERGVVSTYLESVSRCRYKYLALQSRPVKSSFLSLCQSPVHSYSSLIVPSSRDCVCKVACMLSFSQSLARWCQTPTRDTWN